VSVIVIVERIFGLRLVYLDAREAGVHVHDEIVGMVFAASPLSEAKCLLLSDGPRSGTFKNRIAFCG